MVRFPEIIAVMVLGRLAMLNQPSMQIVRQNKSPRKSGGRVAVFSGTSEVPLSRIRSTTITNKRKQQPPVHAS
jgi:hypothetical protein